METYRMWDKTPLLDGEEPVIEYYPAENRKTDCAFVIFPGGGYCFRTPYEGDGYARFLNSHGIDAFVCEYRLCPYRARIPVPLPRSTAQHRGCGVTKAESRNASVPKVSPFFF